MKRFEVWIVRLDPVLGSEIGKTRPGVIISPDEANAALRMVLVAPLTSVRRAWPTRVPVEVHKIAGDVALHQIRAVDKLRLAHRPYRKQRRKPSRIASLRCSRSDPCKLLILAKTSIMRSQGSPATARMRAGRSHSLLRGRQQLRDPRRAQGNRSGPHGRGSPKPCAKSQGDKERYHRTGEILSFATVSRGRRAHSHSIVPGGFEVTS